MLMAAQSPRESMKTDARGVKRKDVKRNDLLVFLRFTRHVLRFLLPCLPCLRGESPRFIFPANLLLALIAISGCTNAVQSGHNTLLDSVDLVQMTDQMARSIVADPRVRSAIQSDGALKVVVQPVENRMTAEVLPHGQAEAFTARVRALLSKHDPGQFVWILNKDDFYDLRQKELDVPLGPAPEAINPQYALTAIFSSLSDESSRGRTDFYLCTYELTNLQTRTLLWSDAYKVKKSAMKGFLD